ncbi:MAG TPA: DUF4231 domain-containing protein [Ktedonobacteraceae bacterium]|nr:DUF4231 domain-containing protein [Ktedonobacteraceae bacterium]
MELFRRHPRLFIKPGKQHEIIPRGVINNYPEFAADFALLERELLPAFRELENEALKSQNAYRGMYLILIVGGTVVTIIGIFQLVFVANILSVLGAIVATLLGVATIALRSLHYHERYLNARLAVEQLRGEYFLFLGYVEPYANEPKRLMYLKQRVAQIKHEGERDE